MSIFLKANLCGINFPEFCEFDRLGENQYQRNFLFRAHLRKLIPAKKLFWNDLRKLRRIKSIHVCFHFYRFYCWIFPKTKKHSIFAKINTCEFWKISLGSYCFFFRLFAKTAVLMQITFLYSCCLQNLGPQEPFKNFQDLWVEPSTSVSYCKSRKVFNPCHPKNKRTTLWKCYCAMNTSSPEKRSPLMVERHN